MKKRSKIFGKLLDDNHSISLSVVLHLLPGVMIVAAYWFIGIPIAESIGYPSLFGFLIAGICVLLPWELGLLIYLGKKRNQKSTFEGIILFNNRITKLKLFSIVVGLIIWAFSVVFLLSFIDSYLFERLFYWLPNNFDLNGFNPTDYSISFYTFATLLNLLLFGISAPLIEELYFRGYLLPRMKRMGQRAPIVNSILFVLYHLWTPWLSITRILFVLPMVWYVWKNKSIEISIWTHCLLNSLGILLTYLMLMNSV